METNGSKNVHFKSQTNEWETPEDVFNELDKEFNFTLDPCATKKTAKCEKYYTKKDNGLEQNWQGERVFMNPPYGREIKHWAKKAYQEAEKGTLIVCLVPSRTDTRYWHNYFMKADEIRFIKGRLKFGNADNSAPFPSALIIFNN